MAQISIIQYKDIEDNLRIGAETYHLSKLNNIKILKNCFNGSKISDFFNFVKKTASVDDIKKNKNVKLLELESISNFQINDILNVESEKIKSNKYIVQKNNVVISRLRPYLKQVGYINENNIYTTTELNILKLKNNFSQSLSKFLYFYLTTDLVQTILFWSQEGTNHPRFPLYILEKLPFGIPNNLNFFKNIYNKIVQKQIRSKQLYKEAEETLLKEIDLLDYKSEHIFSFETTKKETDKVKRFDAEYFQPKYEETIKKIEKYKNGFDVVKNILNFNKKNFFPKENEFYSYIPLSRVSNSGEVENPEKELGSDLPTRARRKVKKGEIILSSISGSLETSAIVGEEHNNFIVSNGFYVFNSEKINSETLLVLFKSKIMIALLQRISKGAILGGYDLTAFEKIKIPLIKPQIQKQIAEKMQESHKLRKESKELLEEAKRKVEKEIEKQAKK